MLGRFTCSCGRSYWKHIATELRCYEPRGAMSCGSPMPRGEQIARPAEWGHPRGRSFVWGDCPSNWEGRVHQHLREVTNERRAAMRVIRILAVSVLAVACAR